MQRLLSFEFNFDTVCVEVKFAGGRIIGFENEVTDYMYQWSEFYYLIYNGQIAYAGLILNGNCETYLKTVTENRPLINFYTLQGYLGRVFKKATL